MSYQLDDGAMEQKVGLRAPNHGEAFSWIWKHEVTHFVSGEAGPAACGAHPERWVLVGSLTRMTCRKCAEALGQPYEAPKKGDPDYSAFISY